MREPNRQRFAELLLYISNKSLNDPKFGSTKLNKILFYSDFLAFAYLGNSITGFEYQKLPHGPAPRGILSIKAILERENALETKAIPLRDSREQIRFVAKRKANLRLFDEREIELVDRVIRQLWGLDADAISALSHIETGWQVANLKETIPYGTIFLSDKALTDDEIRRIQHFAEEHGYSTKR